MENQERDKGIGSMLNVLPITGLIACIIAFFVGYFFMEKGTGELMNFVIIIYIVHIGVWVIYKLIYLLGKFF